MITFTCSDQVMGIMGNARCARPFSKTESLDKTYAACTAAIAVAAGELPWVRYANMVDRSLFNDGLPQRYGTHTRYNEQTRSEELYPLELVAKLVPLGYLAPMIPEEYGGFFTDVLTYGVICEELARVDWVVASVVSVANSLVAGTLLRHGTPAQRERWLPAIARGEALCSACLTEPGGGTDLANMHTRIEEAPGGFRLTGTKVFISHAAHAGLFFVVATVDRGLAHRGITALLVDPRSEGVRIGEFPMRTLKRDNLVEVHFENVFVPAANLVGPVGGGFPVLGSALDMGRYSVAARCVGQAQRCLELAVAYASEREAFGAEDRRVPDDPAEGRRHGVPHGVRARAVGSLIALDSVGVDFGFLTGFCRRRRGRHRPRPVGHGRRNLISGLIIIFGGKVRRGDWIKIEDEIGLITDINALSTRVRTRGSVEYLVPNSSLVSNTIVNYTLSSPLVWAALPVGVSYGSDPRQVERILLAAADQEPMVSRQEKPRVLFIGLGESSLDFSLIFCMDMRAYAERVVKSNLYFTIFDELKKAGIEIPFPQRDIHVHSVGDKGGPPINGQRDPAG